MNYLSDSPPRQRCHISITNASDLSIGVINVLDSVYELSLMPVARLATKISIKEKRRTPLCNRIKLANDARL